MPLAPATSRLSTYWQVTALTVGEAELSHRDAALSAMVRGDWAAFERRLAEGLACASRAAAEGCPPPEDEVNAAAEAFRYQRDLISGSDMTAWLDSTGLSADEWMDFLARDLLRQRWEADLDAVLDRWAPSPRQMQAAAVAEGICSGVFDAFVNTLAEHAALALEWDATIFDAGRPVDAAQARQAVALSAQHRDWLSVFPEAENVARLGALLEIERGFEARSAQIVTEETLHAVLDAHRMDWVGLDLETVSFAEEPAAREAMLCLEVDGSSLADVAGLARRAVTRTHVLLEAVSAEHRDRLLSVDPGRPVGPIAVEGGYQVVVVARRVPASLEENRVASRARQELIRQAARLAARQQVRRPSTP